MNKLIRSAALALIILSTAIIVLGGAGLASFLLQEAKSAETPDISAGVPVVEQPPRTPPTKCGVYAFMSQSLLHAGYMLLGSGIVNQAGDRWVLFQQVEGDDPLLWVILIYLNAPYQGLDIGAACEIMVGRAWVREN
tara:strand:- start:347 stop:757 length:411 start_codon:yes stop_codon:yes gene_type:complete